MRRASQLFTEGDKQAIRAAVTEAEKGTSGEIVPVVATRSGRYDRAEDIFGVVLALIAVGVVWLLFQRVQPTGGAWGAASAIALGLGMVLLTFSVAFVAGVVLATFVPVLARPFVAKKELREEVLRSANQAFFEFRVRRTKSETGMLVYISLFERMVCVVGDRAISEKLGQSHWDAVRDMLVTGLRKGNPTEGICAAIKRCGELLAEHFPIAPDDVNELGNDLHLID
jgi:putative membrane protein